MKRIVRRIIALICALCLLGSGWEGGTFSVLQGGALAAPVSPGTLLFDPAGDPPAPSGAASLEKTLIAREGSWATWQIDVNPGSGAADPDSGTPATLTLTDNFNFLDSYGNFIDIQSIDYASIEIPEDSGITYDYSKSTGTFSIPAGAPVTIRYRARIKAQPGEEVTFGGAAQLRGANGEILDELVEDEEAVRKTAVIYPSASDVAGTSGVYMIKLFVYADKRMDQGIPGAQFILLDANQRPLTYKKGSHSGDQIVFTTHDSGETDEFGGTYKAGYVNVWLDAEEAGFSIEKNTAYYLEMIQAPEGFKRDSTLYSFMITDDPEYNTGGAWTYYNGDTLKVRLAADEPGLNVSVHFSGNHALTAAQQGGIEVVLQKWDAENGWEELERHPYSEFSYGSLTFSNGNGDRPFELGGRYRVIQENERPWDLDSEIRLNTSYYLIVGAEELDQDLTPREFVVTDENSLSSFNVVINNAYEVPKLTLTKMNKETGEPLPGALFTVKRASDDAEVSSYTTDASGVLTIRGGEAYESEVLYYAVETVPPAGYLLPLEPERFYFYFCNDDFLIPDILAGLPQGETAVNLTETFDSQTVDNQKEKRTIPVMKTWQGNTWPSEADRVELWLYQSVDGSEPEPVTEEGGLPKKAILTASAPYNNDAFTDLPARDGNNRTITYSVVEKYVYTRDNTDILDRYVQEYGVSDSGVYVVRNKEAASLTVIKQWLDGNGDPITDPVVLAQQSDVTFDIYRSVQAFSDGTPEDGITNGDMTDFVEMLEPVRSDVSFGGGDWTATVSDLDKHDDTGALYHYYVLETIPSFSEETYVLDEAAGTVTIRNGPPPQTAALTVTKAALVDDPREGSAEKDFVFTLELIKGRHPIRSYPVYVDPGTGKALLTDKNGRATFTLKPLHSIELTLPVGATVTVTEAFNPEYLVSASSGAADLDPDESAFRYEAAGPDVTVTFTNTLHVICKVTDAGGAEHPFESLNSALAYIRSNPGSAYIGGAATIELLEDYSMPSTDEFVLSAGENIVLTTASTAPGLEFPFHTGRTGEDADRAVITRAGDSGSLLTSAGTLTLDRIILDGAKDSFTVSADGGLISSTGTLNLNGGTTLRNSAVSGRGGAIYASGTVNMPGGAITGSTAESGSAVYLEAGTLNMSGGSILGNTGAEDGAVAVGSAACRLNLSGGPVIYGNTNARNEAANVYLGVDSDNVINVVSPGLLATARIGVRAMESHREIGEQFGSTYYGLTEHLDRFTNDIYEYRGKLKDGSATNMVWDGLTLTVRKVVEAQEANSNQTFTITVSSPSIKKTSYLIDNCLDYSITPASKNAPGMIVLRNVRAEDSIRIRPLPAGSYTIEEAASSYAPTYAGVTAEGAPVDVGSGSFDLQDETTVTVTNIRRLAPVDLASLLWDGLVQPDEEIDFSFTAELTDADGTPFAGFLLSEADGILTDAAGRAAFTMSPSNRQRADRSFQAPVGAVMVIREAAPDYRVTVSAHTMPAEGEAAEIGDEDSAADSFTFRVTEDGADISFSNVRKMAEIELRKELSGKVSAQESITLAVTLTRQGGVKAAGYVLYEDTENPAGSIITDDNGQALIPFDFPADVTSQSVTLTIPEGTRLSVAETEVRKEVNGSEVPIYDTAYSINGAAAVTGLAAEIASVSEADRSIVFRNTRRTRTVTVSNTVGGYSGNTIPFTFTASVTDGSENDYDIGGFTDGVTSFELATGQSRTLTVPYGATLTVEEDFIIGYETKVKHGSNGELIATKDEFVVTDNVSVAFTNNQLINIVLENRTSHDLENVQVYTAYGDKMYRVNETLDGQDPVPMNNHWATVSVEAGKTAILEVNHQNSVTYEQAYTVRGAGPADGYYYTISNEPSFHEFADPAVLRIYDTESFQVKGRLRYSVSDSTVTFTEQPLVSFDVNGGAWTTEMEGYNDRDGDRQVYRMAVSTGETVSRPTDPIYHTAEGIVFLGWTADRTFAEASHTSGEDVSARLYDFSTPVNGPTTLYAIWSRPQREGHIVTVTNSLTYSLTCTATLTQSNAPVSGHTLADGMTTDGSGTASISLSPGHAVNLAVPTGAKLALSSSDPSCLAYSTDYSDTDSADASYTVDPVARDGTVSFIGGICKITDGSGALLYDNSGSPAVYMTLSAAFTAYAGALYTDASHTTTAVPAAVKLLVDEYDLTAKHSFPARNMTLTTASRDDTDYPYAGLRDRATLRRAGSFKSDTLFSHKAASTTVTLTNLILDGNNVALVKEANGGLIYVNNGSAVMNITEGMTLRGVQYENYSTANNSCGAAVYVTNGTLNVSASLFTDLHARHGAAIYASNSASLNLSGSNGSTHFENCYAEISGGAIYYSASRNLTIDGGNDNGFKVDGEGNTQFDTDNKKMEANHPGIVFFSCTAKDSGTGDGGAIHINSSGTVNIQGCSFVECSAKVNLNDNRQHGGGAIAAINVNTLTISNCTFSACDTLTTGGAVFVRIKNGTWMTVNNCIFRNDSCKGQGGGIGVYQVSEGNRSTSQLTINGCRFENCSSGTQNGSGGAIQSYLPRMSLSASEFIDCWAGKEGGAINHFYNGSFDTIWEESSLDVSGCEFIRCRAEDRFEPTYPQHYGGGINTKAYTTTITNSRFTDCVSTLREGGALHIGGRNNGSTATISGSTFTNCMAKTAGGAVLSSTDTLAISDSYFYGCQTFGKAEGNNIKPAEDGGGAVSHSENRRNSSSQSTTTITNCVFSADPEGGENAQSCSTVTNGGAIWTRAKNVTIDRCTIDGCTAVNGGGVFLSKNGSQNATITGNSINEVVVGTITDCQAEKGSAVYVEDKATFSGDLKVSRNVVSDISDGAIHGGTLYFEGNVQVFDNTCSADSTYKHDVLMQNNKLTTIQTTANGLETDAKIGVYVPDQNSRYLNYGLEGQKFGTFASGNYLDAFFNDRDSELYGCEMGSDSYIYWGTYVCKITDAEGNTLKRPNGRDAIYQRLTQALADFTSVTGGDPVYIKMLVEDFGIRQTEAISNFPASDVTLTTAGEADARYPYRGTPGTVCTISRSSGSTQLFKLNNSGATFQLENITLDGRNDKSTETGNRRLIEASAGTLVINGGTTMQYGSASNGGAIDAAADARVTINGVYDANGKEPTVKFIDCAGTGNSKPNGGAIRAVNLNIFNSTEETGQFGTAFINCSAYNGGAISVTGLTMEINGILFDGCYSQSAGGAVFHDKESDNTSTTVKNCAFEECLTNASNWAHGGAIEAKTKRLTVENCSFKDCQAASDGGAVYHGFVDGSNKPSGSREKTSIINSTFTGCRTTGTDTAYNYGGSVYTQAVVVEVTGSSFYNSTATNHGGALYCQSDDNSSIVTISGSSFDRCSVTRSGGMGGAVYARSKTVNLQDAEGGGASSINACSAPEYSGAVYMEKDGGVLNVSGNTRINSCYAKQGGAIYLKEKVTMNLTGSPEFTQNGYISQNGTVRNTDKGSCIYLAQGSRLNLSGSPKFSRNIHTAEARVTNGAIQDFRRQDLYLAGYAGQDATSIHISGELTGDTIWVWPAERPHRLPNEQFATTEDSVSAGSLEKLRNALADSATGCNNGEYLSGIRLDGYPSTNVYWDKMYNISFRKKDNKAVSVAGAEFTLFSDAACTEPVAVRLSADGENDTNAQGELLARGTVDFTSIPIGLYYMKETREPVSFKPNDTTYLVLVGSPWLARNENNRHFWDEGALNVPDAANTIQLQTVDSGKYYGIYPLNAEGKADLRANLASANVGVTNIRDDFAASFRKVDGEGNPLPGAEFTLYVLASGDTYDNGYPKLKLWSRDGGEDYPDPVKAANGTNQFRDAEGNVLPKGVVYFRELPIGTYFLLESAYPERNGNNRRTYYVETDRVLRLTVNGPDDFTLEEWNEATGQYDPFTSTDSLGYYTVSNTEAVCKLTDASDRLLYQLGHDGVTLLPAIYPTLAEGFEAAKTGALVDSSRNPVANDAALKLKALKDLAVTETVLYDGPHPLTLTTAERSASASDRYIFITGRTSDTARAELKRGYSEASAEGALITVASGSSLHLQNINLNGQKGTYSGRAVHVLTGGSLTVLNNTQIQKFRQDAEDGSSVARGGAVLMESASRLSINGGSNRSAVFSGNEVLGSADTFGGAIALSVGCEAIDIQNAQFTDNTAAGSGGAISLSGLGGSGVSQTLSFTNAVFRSNSAGGNGGAIYTGETSGVILTMHGSTMGGNLASSGGAVYAAGQAEVTLFGGSINGNTATDSGGAVYAGDSATVIISSGNISGNSAASGSAVYAADSTGAEPTKVTISGGSITGNTATGDSGGAINVGGDNTRLCFSGSPTVFNNLKGSEQRNVVLSVDTNEVINTAPGGLDGGIIGVYVIDSHFEGHGLPDTPFGSFGDDDRLNPQVFINDRNPVLRGTKKDEGDSRIYWQDVICKLTDGDQLLYREVSISVGGKTIRLKAPAIFPTVQEGFDAAQGTLYSYSGSTFSGSSVKLKILQDAALDIGVNYSGSRRNVAFTTAETTVSDAMRARGDYFKYVPGSDRNGAATALISRAFNGSSMISASGSKVLTLTEIELDGGKDSFTATTDGGIVKVSSGGLTVAEGAVLQNSVSSGNGGAVYLANGASMTMNVGTIRGSDAAKGGAVYLAGGATMDLSGGAVKGNTAAEGAGIYLAQGSKLNLSGAPDFGGTGLGEDGELTTAYSGGAPAGNFAQQSTFTDETRNGGKAYPQEGSSYVARQDIFIAGYAGDPGDTNAASLVVAGEITSGDGTIWIWAEQAPHYKMQEQFAKIGTGVSVSKDSFAAFRNARDDATSENSMSDYLSGSAGADPLCVYWGGSVLVSFRKIDSFGNGVGGAEFTLYKDYDGAFGNVAAKQVITEASATAAEVNDSDDDTLQIGDIRFMVPVATYYMRETKNPNSDLYADNSDTIYRVVVEEDQVSIQVYDGTEAIGPDFARTGILNLSLASRLVILRKTDDSGASYQMLKDAEFHIFRMDLTELENSKAYNSFSSGIWFSDVLPYGQYYLVETKAPASPNGYSGNAGNVYKLVVSDSVTIDCIGNMVTDDGSILSEFKEWFDETDHSA